MWKPPPSQRTGAGRRGATRGWVDPPSLSLPASLIAGLLWQHINPSAPFFFGSALAFIAMVALTALMRASSHTSATA